MQLCSAPAAVSLHNGHAWMSIGKGPQSVVARAKGLHAGYRRRGDAALRQHAAEHLQPRLCLRPLPSRLLTPQHLRHRSRARPRTLNHPAPVATRRPSNHFPLNNYYAPPQIVAGARTDRAATAPHRLPAHARTASQSDQHTDLSRRTRSCSRAGTTQLT